MLKLNGRVFGSESFSNGEVSYKPVKVYPKNDIQLYFQSNKDITDLLFAVEFIRDSIKDAAIDLYMYYVPYGRMDRPIDGYVYSLKLFANIINSCNFSHVITLDNHSSGIVSHINNVVECNLNHYIEEVIQRFKPDYIFFPDGGAASKYPKLLNCIKDGKLKYFYGKKQRVLDDTREIKYYDVIDSGLSLAGKRVLVIDDICCTGGTVLEAAKVLQRRGVSEIALWVTHCENNVIKYDIVRENSPISRIYTTNSIVRNYAIPEIEVIDIDERDI
jgi:ribose-phosphate pyrophosphokinase